MQFSISSITVQQCVHIVRVLCINLFNLLFRCTCGNCSLEMLQNISECYCCQELEQCIESLESDLVRADFDSDVELRCITEHPGFAPVCLQKWSLRLASGKYITKSGKRYQQTDDEDR